jgi:hypothetical protein
MYSFKFHLNKYFENRKFIATTHSASQKYSSNIVWYWIGNFNDLLCRKSFFIFKGNKKVILQNIDI